MKLKTRQDTPDMSNLQKCADFVHAFMLGFDIADAVALLCLDDLYVDSFKIKDVKGLGRQGQICHRELDQDTRCRRADTKIHILGSFVNA